MSRLLCLAVTGVVVSVGLSVSTPTHAETDKQRTITTTDLLTIRDIRAMAVSPNGSHVAYQLIQADGDSNSYNISWHVISTSRESEPVAVADDLEAELANSSLGRNGQLFGGEAVWSPNGQWVVYTAMRDGEVQLWRSRPDRYGQEQLTDNAANVESPRFTSDGAVLLFAVGRSREAVQQLNEAAARQGYLAQEPPVYDVERGPILPPCRDNSERLDFAINSDRECDLTIWALDWDTGLERLATFEEVQAYYAQLDTSAATQFRRGGLRDQGRNMATVAPDGQRSAWFENENPEIFQGYRPPMRIAFSDGDGTIYCPLEECLTTRPESLWWNEDGREIIFLVRDGHNESLNSLYGWAPGADEVRTILSSNDMFYDCGKRGERLICGHESWTTPRRIVSVSLEDGEITTIVDPNLEFVNLLFTDIEKIEAIDAYGNVTHAHLVYPEGYEEGRRYPLVIVQYRSGGFLRGGVGDEQPIHVYAQNAFAVLSVDFPDVGYQATEGDLVNLNVAHARYILVEQGPVTAIERMVDDLDRRGIIDPALVGISGLSTGATNTDLALLRRDYAAASTAYSTMMFSDYHWDPDSFTSQINPRAFGQRYGNEESELRRSRSIQANADRINTPYLIQVADREFYFTNRNYHALRGAGKPVELHIFPDEYHIKWQPAHRLTVYNRNVDWFNFWLRGVEDPDPAEAEQYERWRGLCRLSRGQPARERSGKCRAALPRYISGTGGRWAFRSRNLRTQRRRNRLMYSVG